MSLACETCPVRERAACSVLDPEEREALASIGRTRLIKRGEMLFAAGDEDAACATLVSGALKVSSFNEDGDERILALIHPAGFAGELFQPFTHYDVVALSDSQLCTFSQVDMEAAIERYPALGLALLRRSQEDLHAARGLLSMTGKSDAASRVASLILALAQAASDSACHPAERFELPLSRGEIANLAGLTIETVSRRLTKLEKEGAIKREGARGIALTDPARLKAIAAKA
ncbi:Crp/Fnr family transcriptional regulator [Altererythrobacter sp. MF3-039]|uniref:Crp/Fnr family transcriptional regulator n=1 Tax=Altererythrobacter sp. MF3-039 TaxID=3252901 RepID=UPI00390CB103